MIIIDIDHNGITVIRVHSPRDVVDGAVVEVTPGCIVGGHVV